MSTIENLSGNISEIATKLSSTSCKKMIAIFGFCTAIFDGRIKSYLPEGDRLLIVKKDESLILHGSKGVKPLNWQKGGAGKIHYSSQGDNSLLITTFRPKTQEALEIIFTKIYAVLTFNDHDSAILRVYGSESDLSDFLFTHPEIIDKSFQPTTREYETPFGFIDLRGVDHNGNIIIVEVKKRNATPNDAHQLKRYVEYFEGIEKVKVQGILVAQGFSEKVMAILNTHLLRAVAIPWQEIFPTLSNEKTDASLDDFFDK